MDPIPDGSTYVAPPPTLAEPVREAPARSVPAAAPARGSSLTAATLPPPTPRGGVPATRGGPAAAPTRLAALPPQSTGRQAAPAPAPTARAPVLSAAHAAPPAQTAASRGRFGVLGTAHAAVPPTPTAAAIPAGGSGWAVQVGAFSSEAQARSAAAAARNDGRDGRAVVQPVAQGRNTLYRARVTGLSRGSAQQICDRLRSRGGCTVISPDQQG